MSTQYQRIQELEIALEQMIELFDDSSDVLLPSIEVLVWNAEDGEQWVEATVTEQAGDVIKTAATVLYNDDYKSDWEEE